MKSLQSALPNSSLPTFFLGAVTQSSFPPNPVTGYVPGGVTFDPPIGISFSFDYHPFQEKWDVFFKEKIFILSLCVLFDEGIPCRLIGIYCRTITEQPVTVCSLSFSPLTDFMFVDYIYVILCL